MGSWSVLELIVDVDWKDIPNNILEYLLGKDVDALCCKYTNIRILNRNEVFFF
jgi:hypothetical protein